MKIPQIYNRKMLFMLIFGASAGIPLIAAGSTLQAWMTNQNIDIKTIGLFLLVGLPYSFKFLWAPFIDRYSLPKFGRRRGWILLTQLCLAVQFFILGLLSPDGALGAIAVLASIISFTGATQDIVLDAYRRELLHDAELGLGTSIYVAGYRFGLLLGGAVALWISTYSWSTAYTFIAAMMILGAVTTLLAEEPTEPANIPRTLNESFIGPLKNFLARPYLLEVFIFILLYKLGDTLASAMSTVFILKLGFTNTELGFIGKTFGLTAMIFGGIVGGTYIPKLGLVRSLLIFGIIQAIGILPFALLASVGHSFSLLAFAVAAENFTSGMGTAAFLTLLAQLCDKRFSATQYALLTSLMAVPRTLFASSAGFAAVSLGWTNYFLGCTVIAVPALVMLVRANKWMERTVIVEETRVA